MSFISTNYLSNCSLALKICLVDSHCKKVFSFQLLVLHSQTYVLSCLHVRPLSSKSLSFLVHESFVLIIRFKICSLLTPSLWRLNELLSVIAQTKSFKFHAVSLLTGACSLISSFYFH
jgi:hypothetical protein